MPAVAADTELATEKDRLSYAIGMDVGKSLKMMHADIDLGIFLKGVKASLSNGKQEAWMTDDEAREIRQDFFQKLQATQADKQKLVAEENLKKGEAFLAKNKTKKSVITTESGLQYIVLNQGAGNKPARTDNVEVHYRGTLLDGTEFDSSYSRGKPAQFPVNRVIPGWTEALQLMPEGSKYKLFIPAKLAYGARSTGDLIGPNSLLIFEVELLKVL